MKKAALHNLGCKVNAYETEAMQHLLEEAGYEIVPFTQKADVYVINTCSVTNMADRKSRQMLHKAKKNNPDSIVVAAGCYVQTSEKEVLNDLSVDIVIGNDRKHDLVRLLEEYSLDSVNDTVDDINDGKHDFEELFIDQTKEHTRAFIKVQDGCNQFCSYCIIPYARGRVRSRRFENVIAEVERLAANGFKEVVLTGIHLSSYGVDFEEATGLLELIQAVNAVKGIERIRLGSLEPKIVTEHFASELSKLDKICPHFHLSLQSGCDSTLKRMNRKYTTKEYERGCELLRKYFVHPAITTDVIVGFPGETEEEFAHHLAVVQAMPGIFNVNFATYMGRQINGWKGSAVCLLGMLLPPLVIFSIFATFYNDFCEVPAIRTFLRGARPAIIALVALPCIQLWRSSNVSLSTVWIPIGAAIAIGLLGISPSYIILGLTVLAAIYAILVYSNNE